MQNYQYLTLIGSILGILIAFAAIAIFYLGITSFENLTDSTQKELEVGRASRAAEIQYGAAAIILYIIAIISAFVIKQKTKVVGITLLVIATFEKGKKYVNLFDDLSHLNFPDQYQIQFFSQDNYTRGDRFCVFADSTNWITSPPPKFSMTALPSSITLDTGEKKEIQLKINSTSLVVPEVSLRAKGRRGITLEFNPSDPYLPPNGVGLSRLLITARDDAVPGKYVIPVVSNFSFPITNTTAKGANSTFPITDTTVASSRITQYPSIVVTVEKPDLYTQFTKWFHSFWDTY
jgi:hypothetical protein